MAKTFKRSAAEAFGVEKSMQIKHKDSTDDIDDSNSDVQPSTRLISKIQAVELLEIIVQFIPKEYSPGSAVAEPNKFTPKKPEITDVKILSQFKLRYLCRRFRNIIQRLTPLTLSCFRMDGHADPGYFVRISDRAGVRLSRDRTLDQFSELHHRFDCAPFFRVAFKNRFSIPAILHRIMEVAKGPLSLSLHLVAVHEPAISCFAEEDDVSLKQEFAGVQLTNLHVHSDNHSLNPHDRTSAYPVLKRLLEFGQQTLVELSVNVFDLKAAFDPENPASPPLPEDWACTMLQTLNLGLWPNDKAYDLQNSDAHRAAFVAFCARLPHLFPKLSKLALADKKNAYFDFSVMRDFESLETVDLGEVCPTDEQCRDLALLSFTNVNSASFFATKRLLSKLNAAWSNLCSFKYVGVCGDAWAVFQHQLTAVNGSFGALRSLVLDWDFHWSRELYEQFISLLRSLHRLRGLRSLQLDLNLDYDRSDCPAGDFSIIQVLPETVTNARLISTLSPAAVTFDPEIEEFSLYCIAGVPFAEETAYTDWLRMLLLRVSEHPSLEHFFCDCIAPRFEIILALAEKWNKSSVDAIAHLGLTFVVHVQCTPVFARMSETRISTPGDRIRFRFVLALRQNSATVKRDLTKPRKNKTVTVQFEFDRNACLNKR